MAKVALSLGSNLGDKSGTIQKALALLDEGGATVLARSSDYRTPPWGPVPQDWFVNACAIAETDLASRDFLALCHRVERALGRVREVRWGPRIIDIDILAYDDLALESPELMLPHPHLHERAFVLVPLAEIAPDLMVRGRRVADWLARVDTAGIVRID
ncbi:2-amino-4-hydroxy-6-hydroxymethyldihydropteridine diphosphokinase [Microvirga terricola]|uniref:2-amino-4-hydroxy-6-hydroxymethyldihydropteridine pyrophosphokinase n=1 Tax=Microvirga terricola TaxID=2719797 RepID=A0ABX0VDU0_9HYPH|nr:2-amino-4-hydroxy-6-hydroxymethyldihydropteridine diphosphokinase [Microvirga terricola]NIX77135.1 2-amino-4-hydroxy-6-hydroxymethyldihydropteridine diphosphokinase [Microvirga terricola]